MDKGFLTKIKQNKIKETIWRGALVWFWIHWEKVRFFLFRGSKSQSKIMLE